MQIIRRNQSININKIDIQRI